MSKLSEFIKKYDRSVVLVLTVIAMLFGWYYKGKEAICMVNSHEYKIRTLEDKTLKHDQILEVLNENNKVIMSDIKSILREIKR